MFDKTYILFSILCLIGFSSGIVCADSVEVPAAAITCKVTNPCIEDDVRLRSAYMKKIETLHIRTIAEPFVRSQAWLLRDYLDASGVHVDLYDANTAYLKDAVVVVAGCAGPIGQELISKLIESCHVRQVIAIDRNDTELHQFKASMKSFGYNNRIVYCLLDVADQGPQGEELQEIFRRYRPNVIFHLANYKSLMLGEGNELAYLENNLGSTYNLLKCATSEGSAVDRFIYISSNKAGRPDSVYAKTKRLSEFLIRSFSRQFPLKTACIRLSNPVDTSGCFVMRTVLYNIKCGETIELRSKDGQYPARHYTRRSENIEAIIIAGSCARQKSPSLLAFNTHKFKPLAVNDLVLMVAKNLGLPDIDTWARLFVKTVPLLRGERLREEVPVGQPLAGNPYLIEFEDPDMGVLSISVVKKMLRSPTGSNMSRLLLSVESSANGQYAVREVLEAA